MIIDLYAADELNRERLERAIDSYRRGVLHSYISLREEVDESLPEEYQKMINDIWEQKRC